MSLKLLPAALLLFVVFAAGLGQTPRDADASVNGITASPDTVTSGGVLEITVDVGGPDFVESTQVAVTGLSAPSSASLNGTLVVQSCTPACPADEGKSGTSVSVDTDNLDEIVLGLMLTCNVPWTAEVTADPGEIDEASVEVLCTLAGSDEDDEPDERNITLYGGAQVVLTAEPNILPCTGGTTTLYAEAIDKFGNPVSGVEFRFFSTAAGTNPGDGTGGSLVQTSPNTAELTLGPNNFYVKVTASLADDVDQEVDQPTTFVSLDCNNAATLVVTASPNVIDCTGQTTLTASVRDANGHVVPGRGFHFVTSAGLLEVHPNNANNEEGKATLYLRPGDGNATVAVSSGFLHGTYEELDGAEDVEDDFVADETALVTVQQNCLGTTTGQIKVNSSSQTVACGENVFIGLSVIDEDIQTVVDQTPMTLIASAGGFYGGVRDDGTQSLLPAAQVPTSHGEANTIFTAPLNFHGEVKITAASGDAYGSTKLNVTCVVAPVTGTGSGTGSTQAPCVPIGDGVCIAPPNTGRNQITPPSTGDAGLK